MFKSVEYIGFEERPDLQQLAEHAARILASEIRTWHDRVEVEWELHPEVPTAIELTVTLRLSGAAGIGSRYIPVAEFTNDEVLRERCDEAWDKALGDLLDKRKPVWDEILNLPVEV